MSYAASIPIRPVPPFLGLLLRHLVACRLSTHSIGLMHMLHIQRAHHTRTTRAPYLHQNGCAHA